MKTRISIKLWMICMDGKPHKIGDWYSYLIEDMDPKIAVRTYIRSLGGRKKPEHYRGGKVRLTDLEEQIIKGQRRMLVQCVQANILKGWLKTPESPLTETPEIVNVVVQLTDDGLSRLREQPHVMGMVMKAIRKGILEEKFHLKLEPTNSVVEVQEEI